MSVSSEDYIDRYETDGDPDFNITFPVQLDAGQNAKDIKVFYAYVVVTTGTTYPVTTPASIITITRWPELTQSSKYKYASRISLTQLETDLDRIIFCLHRLNGEINRSFRAPITDGDIDLVLPNREDRASHGIAFDATGDNVIPSDSTVANCTPFIETLIDDEDAETARGTLGVYSKDEIDVNVDQGVKKTDTPEFAGIKLYDGDTDADKNIGFASDADILWDESMDEFVMNKPLNTTGIKTDGITLKTKVIEIGDWNMDLSSSLDIPLSAGLLAKIRTINVLIRNDDDIYRFNLLTPYAGAVIGDCNIDLSNNWLTLSRRSSTFLDSTNYDSTDYNRGWVTITYEA